MCLDAPGSSGFGFQPHPKRTEKGEPARHTLLKTHAVVAKIHGVGSWVALSLPTLETQGNVVCCKKNLVIYLRRL
jgi:hypothetical protein